MSQEASYPGPAPSVTGGRALLQRGRQAAGSPPPQVPGAEGKSPQGTGESGAVQHRAGHERQGAESRLKDQEEGDDVALGQGGASLPRARTPKDAIAFGLH